MLKFKSFYEYMDIIHIHRLFLDYSSQKILGIEWRNGEK